MVLQQAKETIVVRQDIRTCRFLQRHELKHVLRVTRMHLDKLRKVPLPTNVFMTRFIQSLVLNVIQKAAAGKYSVSIGGGTIGKIQGVY